MNSAFVGYEELSRRVLSRAENNGRSTDNVRPDRGLDQSNSHLAGHFDRSFLDTNILFSIYFFIVVA